MVVGTVNMPLPRTEILPETPNPRFGAGGWFPKFAAMERREDARSLLHFSLHCAIVILPQ